MAKAGIWIRNGRIWDGERFLRGDLAIAEGRIAALGDVGDFKAEYIYDASGKTVLPGLVDLHVHLKDVSSDAYGMQPEMACLPFGVTAAVDGGACQGSARVLAHCGVKTAVFVYAGIRDDHAVLDISERMLEAYGEKAIGVKTYCDTSSSDHIRTIRPLQEVVAFAEKHGLKVMVHCNHSPMPMQEILETLRPGDILTHAYHGGANGADADQFASLMAAKKRGVIIDSGNAGHVHTDFDVLRQAVEAGALPNTISTDITRLSAYMRGGLYGLPMWMSFFRQLGVEEAEIFRAVTSAAGDAAGFPEWGRLKVGGPADVAVLDESGEGYALTDAAGHPFTGDHSYRCRLTVADGQIVYRC